MDTYEITFDNNGTAGLYTIQAESDGEAAEYFDMSPYGDHEILNINWIAGE